MLKLTSPKSDAAIEAAQELLDGLKDGRYVAFCAVALESANEGCTTFATKGMSLYTAVALTAILHNDMLSRVPDR